MFTLGTDQEFLVIHPKAPIPWNPYHEEHSFELGADSTPVIAEVRTSPTTTICGQILQIAYIINTKATHQFPHVAKPCVGNMPLGGHVHTEWYGQSSDQTTELLSTALRPLTHWWAQQGQGQSIQLRITHRYGFPHDIRTCQGGWQPRFLFSQNHTCACQICSIVQEPIPTVPTEIRCWPTGLLHPNLVAYSLAATREVSKAIHQHTTPTLPTWMLEFPAPNPNKDFRNNWKIIVNPPIPELPDRYLPEFLKLNQQLEKPTRFNNIPQLPGVHDV